MENCVLKPATCHIQARYSNIATVTGKDPQGASVDVTSNEVTSTIEKDASYTVVKSITAGATYAAVGEVITYAIVVTNTGNVTLTNVTVSDANAAITSTNNPIASLAPDASVTVTASHTVDQSDLDAGSYSNIATVTGKDPQGEEVPVTSNEVTSTIEKDASYTVVKSITAGATYAAVGEVITYAIVVTNTGNVTLTNVTVSDANAAITSTNNPIASLAPDASVTVTASHTVDQSDLDAGSYSNIATVTGKDPQGEEVPVTSNEVVSKAIQNLELTIVKTVDKTLISEPTLLTYTIVVENIGNITFTEIVLTDPLIILESPAGDINMNGMLDVAEIWTYTGTYNVTQAVIDGFGVDIEGVIDGNGFINNTATVKGTASDGTEETGMSSVAVEIDYTNGGQASYSVEKLADVSTVSAVGDVITYTIKVANTSTYAVTELVVEDPLLGGALANPTGDINNDGVLDVTETWIYTGMYTVSQVDIDTNGNNNDGDIDNTVTVKGTAPNGSATPEETASVEVPIDYTNGGQASYSVEKLADVSTVSAVGDVITYTIKVANTSTYAVTELVVEDPLLGGALANPTGDINNDGVLDVTETWIYTGMYTVSQVDIDTNGNNNDGDIDNTVTVKGTAPNGSATPEVTASVEVPIDYTNGGQASYSVIKVSDVAVVSYAGDVITYTISVENTSTYGITNLQVIDKLVDLELTSGDTNSNTILDVNEIWTYVGIYTVTKETLAGFGVNELGLVDNDGDIDNVVTVSGNNPAGLLLNPVNDSAVVLVYLPPLAIDDISETGANLPVNIDILANDYDNDGTLNVGSVQIISTPSNGTVVVNSDGTVTYTPNFDFIGEDQFDYQVCDNDGLCDTAVVDIDVIGVKSEEFNIPQGFSPNGDGVHDEFVIKNLVNLYPNFQLQIYNRYGNIVYDYKHNGNPLTQPKWWDGHSTGRMTMDNKAQVPVGTYFYTIYFNKENSKPRSGYVYLNR